MKAGKPFFNTYIKLELEVFRIPNLVFKYLNTKEFDVVFCPRDRKKN